MGHARPLPSSLSRRPSRVSGAGWFSCKLWKSWGLSGVRRTPVLCASPQSKRLSLSSVLHCEFVALLAWGGVASSLFQCWLALADTVG